MFMWEKFNKHRLPRLLSYEVFSRTGMGSFAKLLVDVPLPQNSMHALRLFAVRRILCKSHSVINSVRFSLKHTYLLFLKFQQVNASGTKSRTQEPILQSISFLLLYGKISPNVSERWKHNDTDGIICCISHSKWNFWVVSLV